MKIIAREILYFTLNIFMGLILASIFIFIPFSLNKRNNELSDSYNKFKTFERINYNTTKASSKDKFYIYEKNIFRARELGYTIGDKLPTITNKYYSFINLMVKGSYPHYRILRDNAVALRYFPSTRKIKSVVLFGYEDDDFLKTVFDYDFIKGDPKWKGQYEKFYSPYDNHIYLGEIKIKKHFPKFKYVKSLKTYKYYPGNVPSCCEVTFNQYFSLKPGVEYIREKRKRGSSFHYYEKRDGFLQGLDLPKDLPNPYSNYNMNSICKYWSCESTKTLTDVEVQFYRKPTKNVEMIRYLKTLNFVHHSFNKKPSDFYNELINEENFNDWFSEEFLFESRSKLNEINKKIAGYQSDINSSLVNSYFYESSKERIFKYAFGVIFSFGYIFRFIISVVIYIFGTLKWALNTYFD